MKSILQHAGLLQALLHQGRACSLQAVAGQARQSSSVWASESQQQPASSSGREELHVMGILPVQFNGLQHCLVADVLNFLEDPLLKETDVVARYSRQYLPRAFFVAYPTKARRDAALAIVGATGKALLGTCPVRLIRGTAADIRRDMVPAAGAEPARNNNKFSNRTCVLTYSRPLSKDDLEKFLQGFDLANQRIKIPMDRSPRQQRFEPEGGQKHHVALAYFIHHDEAWAAARSKHNQLFEGQRIGVRVMQ